MIGLVRWILPHLIVYLVIDRYLRHLENTRDSMHVLVRNPSPVVCTSIEHADAVTNALDDLGVSPIQITLKNTNRSCNVWMTPRS
jgi:hypothetical protein